MPLTLCADNTILVIKVKHTYLLSDVSAASGTITVDSIVGFAVNQILLIGEFGNETAEIIKTHASTSPSGSTIALASNTTFAHTQGTKICIVSYDKAEFSRATTPTGEKSVLAMIDIQADSSITQYRDTTDYGEVGYGFARFKDTINDIFSEYSDPVSYAGYDSNMVGYLIEYALSRNKLESFTDAIDRDFCISEINACLRYIRGKKKKWHRLQQFDYVLGQTAQSEWAFAVPSNMWGYSPKSVLDIYLEGETSLTYKDEREWNEMLDGVVHDTLSAAALAGTTSIYLTNSYSFGDTGTVLCRGDEIDFSANNTSTGKLTVTAITNALADGSMVWKGSYKTGKPLYYTVKEGYVYIYPIPDSDYDNINVMIDYWTETPVIDSMADTLDISRFDMIKYWLVASMRAQKDNNGIRTDNDGDYLMFERCLTDAIRIDMYSSGQKYLMKPKYNQIKYN